MQLRKANRQFCLFFFHVLEGECKHSNNNGCHFFVISIYNRQNELLPDELGVENWLGDVAIRPVLGSSSCWQ